MALENDEKGSQYEEQDRGKFHNVMKVSSITLPRNYTKGQNYGISVAGEAELATDDTKGQSDRYSDTEDSADEQERTTKYHRRIIQSWLNGNKKHNIGERKYRLARFKSNGDKQNIIHRAIRDLQGKDQGVPAQALDFLEETVLEQPTLFTDVDKNDRSPMLEAARSLPSILFMAIDLLIPDSTRDIIDSKHLKDQNCPQGQKCPLWEVGKGRRKQCRNKKRPRKLKISSPNGENDITKASDYSSDEIIEDTTRCLHDEVDVAKLLGEDEKLRGVLEKSLNSVDDARKCLQSLISETKFDSGQRNPQIIRLESFKIILKLCHQEVFERAPAGRYSPLQQAVCLLDEESLDFKLLFDVIHTLVEHCPASIFHKTNVNGKTTTAYRLLKELKHSNKAPNKEWIQRADELLKEQCIGYRKTLNLTTREVKFDDMWAEKRDLLYWDPKTEKQFCLNFVGENVVLEEGYIERIKEQAGLQFESVLDFVRLPYWKPAGAKLHRPKIQVSGTPGTADICETKPNPYISIFEWLETDCKVKKIFTVDVNDDGPEPHTNAAIRQCLRGIDSNGVPSRDFKVEVWKWKKFDICSDTVVIAAPDAREVHLYSHGNTAVLRGWACETGLAKLTENSNDEQDCRNLERQFKTDLVKHCDKLQYENIGYKIHGFGARKQDDGISNGTAGDPTTASQLVNKKKTPKSKEWIKELEAFKDFIINLQPSKKPTVKVAILDDGAKLANLDGTQQGRTFRARNEAYFVGPCEHGTEMALCVREICPMAELYIARLDDSRTIENQKFTIASCVEALKWALAMEVDVISMSWTYERHLKDTDTHKQEFQSLIDMIVKDNKAILFGSLPDLGANFELHRFVPVGMPGVIKISSATPSGEVSAENIYTKSNFLLPGEEHEGSTGEILRGSSFATAYAAGLAALVLYTLKTYTALRDDVDADDAEKALTIGSKGEGMQTIFRILSQAGPEDKGEPALFVRPSLTFGNDFRSSSEGAKIDLRTIVADLVPTSVKRANYDAVNYPTSSG